MPIRSVADFSSASAIYHEAFPPEERRPWDEIAAGSHGLALLGVYAGDEFAGLMTIWRFDGFQYIEHFAIDNRLRGSGAGSEALGQALKSGVDAGLPTVLEVEPAEDDEAASQASRRIRFYERAGLKVVDRGYVQPPYSVGLPSVPLWIMSSSEEIDTAEVTRVLHEKVYKAGRFDK